MEPQLAHLPVLKITKESLVQLSLGEIFLQRLPKFSDTSPLKLLLLYSLLHLHGRNDSPEHTEPYFCFYSCRQLEDNQYGTMVLPLQHLEVTDHYKLPFLFVVVLVLFWLSRTGYMDLIFILTNEQCSTCETVWYQVNFQLIHLGALQY